VGRTGRLSKVALLSFLAAAAIAATITPAAAPPIPIRPSVRVPHFDFPPPREVPRFEVPNLERTVPGSELDPRVTPENIFKDLLKKPRDLLDEFPVGRPRKESDTLHETLKNVAPNIAGGPQAPNWKGWQDLPPRVPDTGIILTKGRLTGQLAPEHYPNIRIKNVDSTGPPLSFELFEKTKGVPYSEAIRAFLVGPDSRVLSRYVKSPEGRYVLDLPPASEFPAGSYEIRIVIEGAEATLVRSVSFLSKPVPPEVQQSAAKNVKLYVSKESLEGETKRTTFDTDLAGQKLLNAGRDQLDRAVVHYRDAYEALDHRSSYELRWKTTLNYARALHDAVLWYRYDYASDARMLFGKLLDEHSRSSSKWFWQTKLRDIGITERDIKAPLDDLKALELQRLYVDYSLKREPNNLARLSSSASDFAHQFLANEGELGERIQLDHSKLVSELTELRNSLQKLERPVLVELADGNFLVANVVPEAIGPDVGGLDSALVRSRQLSAK
jgi:hypothetical protein